MVSSACVELPRGPFGLVFSLRNIKNITRQVGVSLCLIRMPAPDRFEILSVCPIYEDVFHMPNEEFVVDLQNMLQLYTHIVT